MSTLSDTGKTSSPPSGFRPTNGRPNGGPQAINGLINVQPPRREDLQPAYAQILQGESEDAGTHGWYGSMSMLRPLPWIYLKRVLICDSQ